MENTLATSSVDFCSDLSLYDLGGVRHNRFRVRCCLLLKLWRVYFRIKFPDFINIYWILIFFLFWVRLTKMILFDEFLNIETIMENTLATSSVFTFSDLSFYDLGGVRHNRIKVRWCLVLKFWRSYFLNDISNILWIFVQNIWLRRTHFFI